MNTFSVICIIATAIVCGNAFQIESALDKKVLTVAQEASLIPSLGSNIRLGVVLHRAGRVNPQLQNWDFVNKLAAVPTVGNLKGFGKNVITNSGLIAGEEELNVYNIGRKVLVNGEEYQLLEKLSEQLNGPSLCIRHPGVSGVAIQEAGCDVNDVNQLWKFVY